MASHFLKVKKDKDTKTLATHLKVYKSYISLFYYLIGLVVNIAVYIAALTFIIKANPVLTGDALLITFIFLLLTGLLGVLLTVFLIRPKLLLTADKEKLVVYKTRRKSETFYYQELTGISYYRRNLIINDRSGKMHLVQYIKDAVIQKELIMKYFNDYIENNTEKYFADQKNSEEN